MHVPDSVPFHPSADSAYEKVDGGTGYSDILLIVPREKTGCVIELKYAENGAFDAALREAMEQIATHEYVDLLRREGMETIHKYGLACYRKACRLAYEKE